ncbi:methyltransferase domain-containing protein [Halobacillus seohaensis]|uniref:Class I SAM-dependent DNA methyltransferase n=1 Tax=Halobacillus seohaensis TaxID=447421 RepID=A0ABW2EEI7_9BACI
MSYQQMAEVYDELMKDAPYDQWVAWTKHMIEKYGPRTQQMLDLGCGTGEITTRLSADFQLTGVDLSAEMLSVASSKERSDQVRWLRQDIAQLEGLYGFDCVISYCDVINYITDESQLTSVFSHVNTALNDQGLFMFDVHSVDHILENLYGQTFAEVYDELSYIWFCDPNETEFSITHDLTFFLQKGNLYDRFDETHYQKGYPIDVLKKLLKQTGFVIERISSDFSCDESYEGNRIFFVCRKV